MNTGNDYGRKIQLLQDMHGNMSNYDLAEKAGISKSAITAIKNKDRAPRIDTLDAISAAFGMTTPDFLLMDTAPCVKETLTPREQLLIEAKRKSKNNPMLKELFAYLDYLFDKGDL